MNSFHLRITDYGDPTHVSVSIFAGPDEYHRALTGTVVMLTEEAADFEKALGALAVVVSSEENAESCPSCGCDWHMDFDKHLPNCAYVEWGGKLGPR